MSKLMTDWLCIATSGTAMDGRRIEPQWLIDCAANYNRETYTALLWGRHHEDNGQRERDINYGEVEALKSEQQGDTVKLYARIIPNQFLVEANKCGQKLFTSAEIDLDFAGQSTAYLFGLAVTDIPASLGTQKIALSLGKDKHPLSRGSVEAFTLAGLAPQDKPTDKPSLLQRLFTAKKTLTPEPNEPPPTDPFEDTALMEELLQLIQALADRVATLEAKATDGTAENPEEAAAEVAEIANELADLADDVVDLAEEVAANPEEVIDTAAFTAMRTKMTALLQRFSATEPPRRAARRARQRRFTARRPAAPAAPATPAATSPTDIEQRIDELKHLLTAKGAPATPLPGPGPADTKPPFEYV